jgi:hypothetical protein
MRIMLVGAWEIFGIIKEILLIRHIKIIVPNSVNVEATNTSQNS